MSRDYVYIQDQKKWALTGFPIIFGFAFFWFAFSVSVLDMTGLGFNSDHELARVLNAPIIVGPMVVFGIAYYALGLFKTLFHVWPHNAASKPEDGTLCERCYTYGRLGKVHEHEGRQAYICDKCCRLSRRDQSVAAIILTWIVVISGFGCGAVLWTPDTPETWSRVRGGSELVTVTQEADPFYGSPIAKVVSVIVLLITIAIIVGFVIAIIASVRNKDAGLVGQQIVKGLPAPPKASDDNMPAWRERRHY